MGLVLWHMGYLNHSILPANNHHVEKIWILLEGDNLEGVTLRNLFVFLLGIHGIAEDDIVTSPNKPQLDKTQVELLFKNKNELAKISQEFKELIMYKHQ